MYNLNVNVTTSASSLSIMESSCTPKTPEILNSLIAMSNPFDTYPGINGPLHTNNQLHHLNGSRVPSSPPEGEVFAHPGSTIMPPPSIQHTCSQLIKEGLKLTIQSKRKHSGGSDSSLSLIGEPDYNNCSKIPKHSYPSPLGGGGANGIGSSGDDEVSVSSPEALWLTAEDAERRRRRRERNKIAATKCRLKKRERTVNLVQESEILETQNHDLKSQIQDLETQRRELMDMLSMHNQTCVKNVAPVIVGNNHYNVNTNSDQQQQHQQQQQQHQGLHHHQQQQQQHLPQHHQYADPYQHYNNTTCSPPQESPSPGFVHEVSSYVQQTGLDSGCLA